MAVLAISHSVGDTNMSLALAEELSKGGIETTFLALGDAAKKRLETEKFATIENKFINKLALTQEELLDLAKKVKLSDYEAVVIGTPDLAPV